MRTVVLVRVPAPDCSEKYDVGYERAAIEGIRRTSSAEVRVLNRILRPDGGPILGWWAKLGLFDPRADLPETVYFFDLDTVFLRDLDRILDAMDADPAPVVGLRDYMRPEFASGVMRIRRDTDAARRVWARAVSRNFREGPGDQHLIGKALLPSDVGYVPDALAPSYKVLSRMVSPENVRRSGRAASTAGEASVICFHGKPTVREVAEDPAAPYHALVRENWRDSVCVSS
ncbi:MAG TPA: hypothetical protein VJP77_05535 [Planctomycetota bacterium]|nr:hypothetical protein [Planctomycetota bacterium]